MKNEKYSMTEIILAAILALIITCGISWIATCGIVKLITMCFGLTFSWNIATGIWLIMCLLNTLFKKKEESDIK